MSKYFPPVHEGKSFSCLHCNVFAVQRWITLQRIADSAFYSTDFKQCTCTHCGGASFWYKGRLVIPSSAPVAPPHPDLPKDCQEDYNEARDVAGRSPKAAAALMRLVLQKLMVDLGEKGENINADIKSLVAKGLPVMVQQALDYCRVVGNNSVHPGEINLNDTPEIAHSLFEMVNFIVEDRIARPKQIKALYDQLPQGARDAIEKRDSTSAAGAK